jgi:hypothetical protein
MGSIVEEEELYVVCEESGVLAFPNPLGNFRTSRAVRIERKVKHT